MGQQIVSLVMYITVYFQYSQEFLVLAFNKYCRNIEDNQKLGSLLYNFILQMAGCWLRAPWQRSKFKL